MSYLCVKFSEGGCGTGMRTCVANEAWAPVPFDPAGRVCLEHTCATAKSSISIMRSSISTMRSSFDSFTDTIGISGVVLQMHSHAHYRHRRHAHAAAWNDFDAPLLALWWMGLVKRSGTASRSAVALRWKSQILPPHCGVTVIQDPILESHGAQPSNAQPHVVHQRHALRSHRRARPDLWRDGDRGHAVLKHKHRYVLHRAV